MVRIHVNRNVVAANRKHGRNDPPRPVRVIHRPDKPLDCGAKVWIEATEARVVA